MTDFIHGHRKHENSRSVENEFFMIIVGILLAFWSVRYFDRDADGTEYGTDEDMPGRITLSTDLYRISHKVPIILPQN